MKSLVIPIVITPTLTLPRQRGRGIPGFPEENELVEKFQESRLTARQAIFQDGRDRPGGL
jgi:hypothetical protein